MPTENGMKQLRGREGGAWKTPGPSTWKRPRASRSLFSPSSTSSALHVHSTRQLKFDQDTQSGSAMHTDTKSVPSNSVPVPAQIALHGNPSTMGIDNIPPAAAV